MKRKSTYLFLLSLIFLSILINTGCTYIWGYHTVVSSDEIRNYDRSMQIALHRVDINKVWYQPKVYDLYPAGLHLLISSFILSANDYNIFDISYIFRILFAVIPTLLAFLIGAKINKWIGLLSSFFYISIFLIFTDAHTHYIYIFTKSNSVATGSVTVIMLFMAMLSFLLSLKSEKKAFFYFSIIYVLASITHGVTHISTFIGQIFNFSLFFLFFVFYGLLRGDNKLKSMAGFFLFLTVLSGLFTFLLYYYPMYSAITGPQYKISQFFPSLLPNFLIDKIFMLLFSMVGLSFVMYIATLKIRNRGLLLYKKYYFSIIVSYVVLYVYVLFSVTTHPSRYVYSFVLIFAPFPTYVSFTNLSLVSIYSLFAGFSIYVLSVVGMLYSYSKNKYEKVIVYSYLVFFMVWFIAGFMIKYYASRIIYLQYFLPFLLAMGAYYYAKRKGNIVLKNGHFFKYQNMYRYFLVFFLVFLLLSVSFVSFINKDPIVRSEEEVNNPFRFGKVSMPVFTYELILYSRSLISDEYILGNTYSVEVEVAATTAKPPSIGWINYYNNHTRWGVYVSALRDPNKVHLSAFCDMYHYSEYMIVGYNEHFYWGPPMPVRKYDSSPYLLKIYQGSGGQRMYLISLR